MPGRVIRPDPNVPVGERMEVYRCFYGSSARARWSWRHILGGNIHTAPAPYRYRWTARRGAIRDQPDVAVFVQGRGGKGWRKVRGAR